MATASTKANDQVQIEDIFAHFSGDMVALNETLDEIEELYRETKKHFDDVKNARSGGTLQFIEKQTGNLINLKSTKINILKEKTGINKTIADYLLKVKRAENADEQHAELVKELYNKIMKDPEKLSDFEEVESGGEEDQDDFETSMNNRLKELMDSGGITLTDNEKRARDIDSLIKSGVADSFDLDSLEEIMGASNTASPSKEEIPYNVVVILRDKKWSFAAMSEEGKILKDVELPNKKDYKIKLTKSDGKTVAVDQDDRMYKVIKKKAKEKK